jgi:RNase P subunit RPR2
MKKCCSQLSTYFKRHMTFRSNGLSDCVEGSCRDWNHTRKYPKIGFSWMKETLDFSF